VAEATTLGEGKIPHCQRTKGSWDVVTPPGLWTTSEPLSRGLVYRTCLAKLSWAIWSHGWINIARITRFRG